MLRVYVFERSFKHPQSAMLRVAAIATSSEFMVVSYRRATAELRADRRILAMLTDSAGAGHAVQAIVDVDKKEVLLPLQQQQLQLMSTSSPDQRRLLPLHHRPSPAHGSAFRIPDTQDVGDTMWQELKLWESSHPETLMRCKHLAILHAFLLNVDVLRFTHCLSHWSTLFADLWGNSPLSPTNQHQVHPCGAHTQGGGVPTQVIPAGNFKISWHFLTQLSSTFAEQQQQTDQSVHSPGKPNEALLAQADGVPHLVQTCADLVGWLVFDGNNLTLFRELFVEYAAVLLDKDALRGSFVKWIHLVYDLMDRFLASKSQQSGGRQPSFPSMRALTEDIISVAFKCDALQKLRPLVLDALSATTMVGLQGFVAQVRSHFVRTRVGRQRAGAARGMALSRVLQSSPSPFQGSWCFDGAQSVIHQLDPGHHGISVAMILDWMRECAGVTIRAQDDESVCIRSMWSLDAAEDDCCGDPRGMLLIADRHARVFSHFPSGLSSMIPMSGGTFGDYRAHFASPDCLEVELYAWPESAASEAHPSSQEEPRIQTWRHPSNTSAGRQSAVRWKLRLSLERFGRPTAPPDSPILRADGVIERALQASAFLQSESSIQEKLAMVDQWQPTHQVSAVYRRVVR